MDANIRIFKTADDLAGALAGDIKELIGINDRKGSVTIAVSGGRTPEMIFPVLAGKYSGQVNWQLVNIFWVDERCVGPDESESNYGMAKKLLLDRVPVPAQNIHRMRGEEEPEKEAERYSAEIMAFTRARNGLPFFDMVLLGLGEDGHTASIFPGNEHLFDTGSVCTVASHPLSGQKRITLTGEVINNAGRIIFIVTGKSKAEIIAEIINEHQESNKFPASYVKPVEGKLAWYLDEAAGSLLKNISGHGDHDRI